MRIPEGAAFLEFSPTDDMYQETVVWNRNDPKRSRGSVHSDYWEMTGITQEDSGYYKFRGKSNTLLVWKRLEVKGNGGSCF